MNDPFDEAHDRHSKRSTAEIAVLAAATAACAIAGAIAGGLLPAAAGASETINYSYDARGRLVAVSHSGTVNNAVVANYSYDKADNRTNKNVTGAP